jgi:hypothetical protein
VYFIRHCSLCFGAFRAAQLREWMRFAAGRALGYAARVILRERAMAFEPPRPQLEYLFRASVAVAAPRALGKTPLGERRIIDITGGEISGPKLSGQILSGGADWQIIRADGVAVLEARYTIEAADGALVYVQNFGYRHGPADVLVRIYRGEDVDPAHYYFRSTPVFETSAPALDWMNRTIAVCSGVRNRDRVILDVFAVE